LRFSVVNLPYAWTSNIGVMEWF